MIVLSKDITKTDIVKSTIGLILFTVILYIKKESYIALAIGILLSTCLILKPLLLKPITLLILNILSLLRALISKTALFLIFYMIITPIGVAKRLLSKTKWKQSQVSVFEVRNKVFSAEDLKEPF